MTKKKSNSFHISKHFIKNFILFIVSSLLCIALLESALRLNIINIRPFSLLDPQGYVSYPFSSDIDYEGIGRFDEKTGYALRENLTNKFHRVSNISINTDSIGARGKDEYELEHPGKIRIVTLGDSYTFGEGVSDNSTYSSRLESMLPDAEVINLGVYAYGFDQALLRFEETGEKLSPDIVILGFWKEDIDRVGYDFFAGAQKPHFKSVDGRIVLTNTPLETPEEYKKGFHVKTFRLFKSIYTMMDEESIGKKSDDLSFSIIRRLIDDANSVNSTLIILYLPDYEEAVSNISSYPIVYAQICNEKKVLCLDPRENISSFMNTKTDNKKYFDCASHYCPEIHELIAEKLYEKISLLNMSKTSKTI